MRQTRYKIGSQIASNISEIKGKKANIVFKDGRVSFGWILEINESQLLLKNMRLNKSTVELKQISEIIIDSKA